MGWVTFSTLGGSMARPKRFRLVAAAASAVVLALATSPSSAAAKPPAARQRSTAVQPAASMQRPAPLQQSTSATATVAGLATGSKAPTSGLAETDAALLNRTDDALLPVVIKLDYEVGDHFGLPSGFPTTYVYDRTGHLRFEERRAINEAKFGRLLEELLAEPVPAS